MQQPVLDSRVRARRRDAWENRERLVEAAVRSIGREGMRAPVAAIATEAGVGIGTCYRCFADRDALMQELEARAYTALNEILDAIEADGLTGLPAVHRFLVESLQLGDRLVLPLHGAPPLVDDASIAARRRIDGRLQRVLEQGRATETIVSDVNATDVIMCSALISRPLRHGPNWDRSARRHIALFVAGLTTGRKLPGPPVRQSDIERTFRRQAGAGGAQVR